MKRLMVTLLALQALPALAAAPASDGSVLLRMCRGGDKVKSLAVMCHSYLNGYLDASEHFGKRSGCLGEHDKEHLPEDLVKWIDAHPGSQAQPAGRVLDTFLADAFPCRKR